MSEQHIDLTSGKDTSHTSANPAWTQVSAAWTPENSTEAFPCGRSVESAPLPSMLLVGTELVTAPQNDSDRSSTKCYPEGRDSASDPLSAAAVRRKMRPLNLRRSPLPADLGACEVDNTAKPAVDSFADPWSDHADSGGDTDSSGSADSFVVETRTRVLLSGWLSLMDPIPEDVEEAEEEG